jgi:hypothetical protein
LGESWHPGGSVNYHINVCELNTFDVIILTCMHLTIVRVQQFYKDFDLKVECNAQGYDGLC